MNMGKFRPRLTAPAEDHVEPAFDVGNLEQEIRDVVALRDDRLPEPSVQDFAPPTPLPAYVQHAADIGEMGRLTAEVVVQQYEQTAKDIEAMAGELIEMQRRVEQEAESIHRVLGELRETAQRARDEGKAAFESIERQSKMTDEVRQACEAIRLKLAPQ